METTVELKRRRFTLEEYHRMGEVGIFGEKERVELIEGEIVEMSPIGLLHAGTVDRIADVFARRLAGCAIVRVQGPILLADLASQPQPDVSLLMPRPDFYTTKGPGASDIFLVVKVMDSTVAYDRDVKLPLYARAGIAEVWLANVNTRRIEVYRRPSAEGYGESAVFQRDEPLFSQAFADVVFTVAELLG
jgi:Uma2 family endonuclease